MTREDTLQLIRESIPALEEPLRASGSATLGHFAWTLTDTQLTLADLTTNLVLDHFPFPQCGTNRPLQDWLKSQRNRMRLHLTTVCAQAGLETFIPTDRPPALPLTLTNLSCPLSRISLLFRDKAATTHDLLTFMLHLVMFYCSASEGERSQIHLVSPMPTQELLGQCLYDLYPDWGIAQPLKHISCGPCPVELSSQWLRGCFNLDNHGEGTIILSDLTDSGRSYNSQAVPVLYQHPSLPTNMDLLRTVMDVGPIRLILVYRGQHLIPDWISSIASTIIEVTSGITAIKVKPKPPLTLRVMPVQP